MCIRAALPAFAALLLAAGCGDDAATGTGGAPGGPDQRQGGAGEASSVAGRWIIDREALLAARIEEFQTDLEGVAMTDEQRAEVVARTEAFDVAVQLRPDGTFHGTIKDPQSSPSFKELEGTWEAQDEETVRALITREGGKELERPYDRWFLLRGDRLSMDHAGRSLLLRRP